MRKALIWICSLLGLVVFSAVAVALGDYSWRNRPFLVFAEDVKDVRLAKQVAIVRRNKHVFKDRDMVVVVVQPSSARVILGAARSLSAPALRNQYGVGRRDFRVLLIGKDTGVKLSSNAPVSARRLISTIDSMPMRQQEMRIWGR